MSLSEQISDNHSNAPEQIMDKPFSKRFILGSTVFIVGFLSPALTPLVVKADLPVAWKTVLTGALAFGIPEVMALVAVAIMGKEGFEEFKRLLWGLLKKAAPQQQVGRTRYRIGLVMFGLPLVFAWAGPYLHLLWPRGAFSRLAFPILGDVIFISSLFVLGGGFWDKLRSLFVWGPVEQSQFPVSSSENPMEKT